MARRKSDFGSSLSKIIFDCLPEDVHSFLSSQKTPDGALLSPPSLDRALTPDETKDTLVNFVTSQDVEIRTELDRRAGSILELSDGKGATSLDTVAARRLTSDQYDIYEGKLDATSRSIWVYACHPEVFRDAESFHAARRYRDHGKMYAAFEVDLDDPVDVAASDIDSDNLCRKLEDKLGLKLRASASIIDLPETPEHLPSIMVALRHPGALSSIQDHRVDGYSDTYYYRPSHEAVLIYTPKLRKIEVCAESPQVRNDVSALFAEAILGQDLSKRPLTRRNYNLDRFRASLSLPLPDFDDVEITSADIVEIAMPLGDWSRRLGLTITKADNITDVLEKHFQDAFRLLRRFGLSKVAIAVGYQRRTDGKSGTLRLTISGGNNSSVQSLRDPYLRELGYRLLTFWKVLDELRPLTDAEKARWFLFLLSIYEMSDNEISGATLSAAGVDPKVLIDGCLIEKKKRQVLVLEDDDEGVIEVDVLAGREKGQVAVEGAFGAPLGTRTEAEVLVYRVSRGWLAEMILKIVCDAFPIKGIQIIDDNLAQVAAIKIGGQKVPVYLARQLDMTRVIDKVDIALRLRHAAGTGLVLTTSDTHPTYIGPNVVVALRNFVGVDDTVVKLDVAALEAAFIAGRTLVGKAQLAQVIRQSQHFATLIMPGEEPLHLDGVHQITVFERLVEASANGTMEVRTAHLTAGMNSASPQQLFSATRWREIFGKYISHGTNNRYWRIGRPSQGHLNIA